MVRSDVSWDSCDACRDGGRITPIDDKIFSFFCTVRARASSSACSIVFFTTFVVTLASRNTLLPEEPLLLTWLVVADPTASPTGRRLPLDRRMRGGGGGSGSAAVVPSSVLLLLEQPPMLLHQAALAHDDAHSPSGRAAARNRGFL